MMLQSLTGRETKNKVYAWQEKMFCSSSSLFTLFCHLLLPSLLPSPPPSIPLPGMPLAVLVGDESQSLSLISSLLFSKDWNVVGIFLIRSLSLERREGLSVLCIFVGSEKREAGKTRTTSSLRNCSDASQLHDQAVDASQEEEQHRSRPENHPDADITDSLTFHLSSSMTDSAQMSTAFFATCCSLNDLLH